MRLAVLRDAAIKYGLVPPAHLAVPVKARLAAIGERLFETRTLSLNGEISCRDCHLDEFGSADGLPNAVGVGGEGKGISRMGSGGEILPRNVLPLWGRGQKGFETFFWDGKVERADEKVFSQFGAAAPSDDPLVIAAHLPFVEVREMVANTIDVRDGLMNEDVAAADQVFALLTERLRRSPTLGPALAGAAGVDLSDLTFRHAAEAIAAFIRTRFAVRSTRFHEFVFNGGSLTRDEMEGGILFYGRGRCVSCHDGPYFSDFEFHAVAFPQAGFGKNGFGIDEGRFNVTFDPADRFLFRTPPLYNVSRTAPYGHSGSLIRLEDAIATHGDPLRFIAPGEMTEIERSDMFLRLGRAANEPLPAPLHQGEILLIAEFLRTLEY